LGSGGGWVLSNPSTSVFKWPTAGDWKKRGHRSSSSGKKRRKTCLSFRSLRKRRVERKLQLPQCTKILPLAAHKVPVDRGCRRRRASNIKLLHVSLNFPALQKCAAKIAKEMLIPNNVFLFCPFFVDLNGISFPFSIDG